MKKSGFTNSEIMNELGIKYQIKKSKHLGMTCYNIKKGNGVIVLDEILKQILSELQKVNSRLDGLEKGQRELITEVADLKLRQVQIKDNLINGLGPYFEQIEKHIDTKTEEIKNASEDQQLIIDTLAARSVKHESEIKDFKRILKNQ